MINHYAKSTTISCRSLLATPKHRSQCWILTESAPPPGPAPPESCPATSVTVLSVMSTGMISGGRSGYVSRLSAVGVCASGCLVCSTYITLSPVVVHISNVCSMPPVSRSVIHLTAVRGFPLSTRLWKFLALCSSDFSLRAEVRYCAYVRRFSSTNIPCHPASQESRIFSILQRISWDAVT